MLYTRLALLSVCLTLFGWRTSFAEQAYAHSHHDAYIQGLASLVFYTSDWETSAVETDPMKKLSFSEEEVASLWEKVHQLHLMLLHPHLVSQEDFFEKASHYHLQALRFAQLEQVRESLAAMKMASSCLEQLWREALAREEAPSAFPFNFQILHTQMSPSLEHHSSILNKAKRKMKPFLVPLCHLTRAFLDELCSKARITANLATFKEAGFKIITKRPRSFILVAKHPQMPGYLVKVYLDTVLDEKQHQPSWKWLVNRCIGAQQIQKVIRKKKIEHFTVAKKWIYCLPAYPSPPKSEEYTQHLALLVVTDMNLTSYRANRKAWKSVITPRHLDELYLIISRARGSSYRPDNIAYTSTGKFAFIDTEYPCRKPDFASIRRYLSPEMLDYWDRLVKNGGSQ